MLADGRLARPRRFRLVMLPYIGAQANITPRAVEPERVNLKAAICGPRANDARLAAYCQSTMIMPNQQGACGTNESRGHCRSKCPM